MCFDKEEARTLGGGMLAEGWQTCGGDWLLWMHPPTQRAVSVDGPFKWHLTSLVPAYDKAPTGPDDEGYVVSCRYFDDLGNPTVGNAVFVTSYALAIKLGRRIRSDILAERPAFSSDEQLTLDDVLARGAA
jgi:hypothetical protein